MIDQSMRESWKFFALVFALSVPFAVLGAVTGTQLMAGVPISALGFVCPVTAASILVYRANGTAAVWALLKRSFDYRRIDSKVWYVAIFGLMPAVTLATYWILHALGESLATPAFSIAAAVVLFVVFFLAALGEELGWSGYAIDRLQRRFNTLEASIILGSVWAVWHIVAMIQGGQSTAWIAWGCLDMIATRVIMVWLYNNTGKSVFAVALYHAVANVSIKTLFPGGSYHAERVISVMLVVAAAVTFAAAIPSFLHPRHARRVAAGSRIAGRENRSIQEG